MQLTIDTSINISAIVSFIIAVFGVGFMGAKIISTLQAVVEKLAEISRTLSSHGTALDDHHTRLTILETRESCDV